MALADVAALFADPTRATMCVALLDGRAWTLTELARTAGVAPSTASEHLSRLTAGGVLAEERQGKHRYVRLAGSEVAALIEALSRFSTDPPRPRSLRDVSRRRAEARARTCYDHLAGYLGVAVADAMVARGYLDSAAGISLTPAGADWLGRLGVDLGERGRRPLVTACLDWTERRTHVAGAVGAAFCATAFEREWIERFGSGRALRITEEGERVFRAELGVEPMPEPESVGPVSRR